MTPPLLIFDFDGVLVDSEVLANAVLADMLTEQGFPIDVVGCHRRFTGVVFRAIRPMVEGETGRSLPSDFEAVVQERSKARFEAELRPIAGAAEMLRALQGPRCIASNSGPGWVEDGLRIAGLDGFFERKTIFSAAHVACAKPAPDLFLHAAASMGVDPAACVVVEDSLHGITGARAAGMRVLGFTGASHNEADHADVLSRVGVEAVFDDLTRLPDLLRSL